MSGRSACHRRRAGTGTENARGVQRPALTTLLALASRHTHTPKGTGRRVLRDRACMWRQLRSSARGPTGGRVQDARLLCGWKSGGREGLALCRASHQAKGSGSRSRRGTSTVCRVTRSSSSWASRSSPRGDRRWSWPCRAQRWSPPDVQVEGERHVPMRLAVLKHLRAVDGLKQVAVSVRHEGGIPDLHHLGCGVADVAEPCRSASPPARGRRATLEHEEVLSCLTPSPSWRPCRSKAVQHGVITGRRITSP